MSGINGGHAFILWISGWQGIDVRFQQYLHMYLGDQRWLQMDVPDQLQLQIIIYGINSDCTCISGNMNAKDQWWLRIYVGDQW